MNVTKTIASAVAALTVAGFAYAQSTTDPAVTKPTQEQTVTPNSANQPTSPMNSTMTPNSTTSGSMNSSSGTMTTPSSDSSMNNSSSTLDSERAPQADRG